MRRLVVFLIGSVMALGSVGAVEAHGGGLNAQGCHNDRRNGGYHCHRGSGGGPAPTQSPRPAPTRRPLAMLSNNAPTTGGPFPNCAAVRAAGAAPVRQGDPGYSRRLDRDGDGVGCE